MPTPVERLSGVTKASNHRSSGTRSKNSTRCGSPRLAARRIASTRSGMRKAIRADSPRRKAGAIPVAASLNAITRLSRSSTIAALGKPAISCSTSKICGCASARPGARAISALETASVRPRKTRHAPRNRPANPAADGKSRRSSSIAMSPGVGFFGFNLAANRSGRGRYSLWLHRPPLAVHVEPQLPRTENEQRNRERRNIVEHSEQEQSGEH